MTTMARLKFYEDEAGMFNDMDFIPRSVKVDKNHVLLVCRKLSRHFKFECPEVKFYGTIDSGSAHRGKWIRLSTEPSYRVIIHELAHSYNYQKYGKYNHCKKLMRTIKKFAMYVKKMNYWDR